MLRRLTDDEKPLQLCLRWSDDGADSLNRRQFVLQDNVTSEIAVRTLYHLLIVVINILNKQVGRVAETRQYFAFCEMFVVLQLHASLSERVFKHAC